MSEKEKDLVERIQKLPPEAQDKFETLVKGAEIALDAMRQESK